MVAALLFVKNCPRRRSPLGQGGLVCDPTLLRCYCRIATTTKRGPLLPLAATIMSTPSRQGQSKEKPAAATRAVYGK